MPESRSGAVFPKEGPYSGKQLGDAERLDYVVVRTGIETANRVLIPRYDQSSLFSPDRTQRTASMSVEKKGAVPGANNEFAANNTIRSLGSARLRPKLARSREGPALMFKSV